MSSRNPWLRVVMLYTDSNDRVVAAGRTSTSVLCDESGFVKRIRIDESGDLLPSTVPRWIADAQALPPLSPQQENQKP